MIGRAVLAGPRGTTGLIIRSNGNAAAWRPHADDNMMSASCVCVLHDLIPAALILPFPLGGALFY